MITLEQVERLREKASISFEDAKAALEATDGDLLNAIIYLEKQGKVTPPAGGGYYSSKGTASEEKEESQDKGQKQSGESFSDMMKRFGRFCGNLIGKGNSNYLEADKAGKTVLSLPVTVVVLLLVLLFWVTVPLFIVSLFFGFRYRFRGSELGKDSVNKVMDGASDTVDEIKRSINSEHK